MCSCRRSACKIGPAAGEAVPVLIKTFRYHTNIHLRLAATEALGEIGPIAVEAVPELVNALSNNKENLDIYASRALAKIGPTARPYPPSLRCIVKPCFCMMGTPLNWS